MAYMPISDRPARNWPYSFAVLFLFLFLFPFFLTNGNAPWKGKRKRTKEQPPSCSFSMLKKKGVGRPRKDDPEESSWSEEQISRLFDYWEEHLQAYKTGKKQDFFKGLADALKAKTVVQCRNKVGKLNAEYESAKKENNQSGGAARQWKYFEKMDGMFGHRENVVPTNISGSMDDASAAPSVNTNENDEPTFSLEDLEPGETRTPANPLTPTASSKRRGNSQLDSWMVIQKESLELKRLKMDQDFALESQKLEVMRAESSLRLADFEARRSLESRTLELKMQELEQQRERNDVKTRMLFEQLKVEQEKMKLMFELEMKKLEKSSKD